MEQDSGGEGRGGAARGPPSSSARRLGASPRTAEQLCSRLRLLRSAPPRRPPARRALHYPARRPPSFVATTSAGRGARAGALRLSARVSGSAVSPSLRAAMDVVRRWRGFVGLRSGPAAPHELLEWCLPAFYTPAGCKGREHARPLPRPHVPSRRPRDRGIGPDAVMAVSLSRLGTLYTALEVSPVPRPSQSPRTTQTEAGVSVSVPPPPTRRTLPCKHLLWLLLWSCERHLSWSQFPNFCPGQECVQSPCVMKGQGSQRQLEEGLLTFFTECMQPE